MHEHFQVLGEWHPDTTDWPTYRGSSELQHTYYQDWPHSIPFALDLGWEVRTPQAGMDWRYILAAQGDPGAEGFHKDGAMSAIVVWSNIYPTEIKLPHGTIAVPKPGTVVLINNRNVWHRTPPNYLARITHEAPKRWFMRRQLPMVPSDDDIAAWEKALR